MHFDCHSSKTKSACFFYNLNKNTAMNFKIIRIPETSTEICLHRDRSEEGEEIVRITSFVLNTQRAEVMLEQVVTFSKSGSSIRFVADYSLRSARRFLTDSMIEAGLTAFVGTGSADEIQLVRA
jgi:hypothetical protein